MANLAQEAMLVHLRTRQWTGTRTDKRIKDAAVAKHGVSSAAVRGGQKLLVGGTDGEPLLKAVQALYGEASRQHLAATLPWLDSGERILTAPQFQTYMERVRATQDAIETGVEAFASWYEGEYRAGLPSCRAVLNGLFDSQDYLAPSRLRRAFVLEVEHLPFPTAEDFRVDLGAGEVSRIKAQIERAIETALAAAMADVWERIGETVGHLAERLRSYDPSGDKVVGKFHDTLTLNVRELVELLPGLNVTRDPRVTEITGDLAAMLSALPGVGSTKGKDEAAGELRDSDALRAATAASAEAVMAKMADFV